MMISRERLFATLNGDPVDRPAVSFYEIGGLTMDPSNPDPFNIYSDPSWLALLKLAEQRTDLIRMRSPIRPQSHQQWDNSIQSCQSDICKTEQHLENGCLMTRTILNVAGVTLSSLTRRDPDIDTVWTVEHLLKSTEDIHAYMELPDEFFTETIDISPLVEEETSLGNRGIVMVDTEDPLCAVATLFNMEDFTVFAMTENKLCHRLLEKCARYIHRRTEQTSRLFPGHLWRIYGPEFATEPYLPPSLFDEYVVRYDGPMIDMIHKHAGFARIHIHGKICNILQSVIRMGADAIDPIEPPPQGDVDLGFVRSKYGENLVLFGNLEIADIENMEPNQFETLVRNTLAEGTAGQGRGFVLMPSASPYGRKISLRTMQNYETIIRVVEEY